MGSHIIREFNEEHECDKAFTDDVNQKIGCFDEEANFLRYRDRINEVEIYIVFSFDEEKYMAFFRKYETFEPKETSFEAKTWEMLMQHIDGEMRNSDFSQFLGVLTKKKIARVIRERSKHIFENRP